MQYLLWQGPALQHSIFVEKPGLTSIEIITLALGIGASTAIFRVVNGALLRLLPFY
jgi:hypothetical protein